MIKIFKYFFLLLCTITSTVYSQLLSTSPNYVCIQYNNNIECRLLVTPTINTINLINSNNTYNKIEFNGNTDILCAGSALNIRCWNVASNNIIEDNNGNYKDFYFECVYKYVLDDSNNLYINNNLKKTFQENVQQIRYNNGLMCTVNDVGLISCYNIQSNGNLKLFSDSSQHYVSIYMNSQRFCALDNKGMLYCWNQFNNFSPIILSLIDGNGVSADNINIIKFNNGDQFYALRKDGTLLYDTGISVTTFSENNFYDISFNSYSKCYLSKTFNLYCNGFLSPILLQISTVALNTMTNKYRIGTQIKPCQNGSAYDLYYQGSPLCAGACSAGRFGTGILECSNVCYQGYYCPSGSISPTICPSGTYNSYSSKSSIVDCLDCPIGYYCLSGSTDGHKNMCDAGYYGSTSRQVNGLCSGICPRGYRCPSGSTSPQEFTCGSPQYYCPTGTSIPQQVSPGYFSEGGTLNTNYYQTICPFGTFCINGQKYQCQIGTYSNSTGLTSCISCDSGSVTSLIGSTSCTICGVGTYTLINIQSEAQYCQSCEIGKYQDLSGKTFCNLCAIGKYQNLQSQTFCYDCADKQKYSDMAGSTSCKTCIYGMVSMNNSRCEIYPPCKAGFYPNNNFTCQPCPYNTISGENYTQCISCRDGTYSLKLGSTTCSICEQNGLLCMNGISYVEQGYWTIYNENDGTLQLYKCRTNDDCLLQIWSMNTTNIPSSCPSDRYQDPSNILCSNCESGYTSLNNYCTVCNQDNGALIFTILIIIFVFTWFIHYISNISVINVRVNTLIYFIQLISLIFVDISPSFDIMIFFNVINMQIDQIFGRDVCIFSTNPIRYYVYFIMMPFLFICMLIFMALNHFLIGKYLNNLFESCDNKGEYCCCKQKCENCVCKCNCCIRINEFEIIPYIRSFFGLTVIFYFYWTKKFIDFFNCVDIAGSNVLRNYPNISCGSNNIDYNGVIVLVIIFFIIFSLNIIGVIMMMLESRCSVSATFTKVLDVWTEQYTPSRKMWFMVDRSKRMALVLFSLIVDVRLKFFIYIIVLLFYIFINSKYKPFKNIEYRITDYAIEFYMIILSISIICVYDSKQSYLNALIITTLSLVLFQIILIILGIFYSTKNDSDKSNTKNNSDENKDSKNNQNKSDKKDVDFNAMSPSSTKPRVKSPDVEPRATSPDAEPKVTSPDAEPRVTHDKKSKKKKSKKKNEPKNKKKKSNKTKDDTKISVIVEGVAETPEGISLENNKAKTDSITIGEKETVNNSDDEEKQNPDDKSDNEKEKSISKNEDD